MAYGTSFYCNHDFYMYNLILQRIIYDFNFFDIYFRHMEKGADQKNRFFLLSCMKKG